MSTLSDERLFDFDATRVYATLGLSEVSSPLNEIVFEVQIRTLLQHAWSRITHPLVCKAAKLDPKRLRLAAEVLANLEGLDRDLSTFSTTSRSVKTVRRERSTQLNAIISMMDDAIHEGIVPSVLRPKNGRRYAESVLSAMDLQNAKFSKALRVVRDFYTAQGSVFPLSVSLQQLAMVALHRAKSLNSGSKGRPRYHYVTPELVSLFPECKSIAPIVAI